MKYQKVLGWLESLINLVGGEEGLERLQRGELVVVEKTERISATGQSNGGITFVSGLDTAAFLADWTRFYQEVFNITVDLLQVPLPSYRPGFHWGVAVALGLTNERVYNEFAAKRTARKSVQNLDDAVFPNDRGATDKSYVVWCRDRVEADEELRYLSADKLREKKVKTMTLLERQLLGRWFYWKTAGGDLDIKNITICAGSRESAVYVPRVDRGGDGAVCVYADRCTSGAFGADLRAREVVSV